MYDYSNSLNATMVDSITGVEGLDPGMSDNPGNYQLVFGFNEQPTDDLIFRKAVRAALDYELLRVTIGGEDGQIPHAGIVAPPNKGFDGSLPELAQDVDEANALLDEGGYVDADGDGWRDMPDGSELNVPHYSPVQQDPSGPLSAHRRSAQDQSGGRGRADYHGRGERAQLRPRHRGPQAGHL